MVLGQTIWNLVLRATDEDYPRVIHVPHALISVAHYRKWRQEEGEPHQWLYDALVSCFASSQGGGINSKAMLEGLNPVYYFARNAEYVHVQVVAYLLNYWSPGDVVYKIMTNPRNPLRLCSLVMDALDTITTLCGLTDGARKAFPENKLLPFMVGMALFKGGAFYKYLDGRSRGKQAKGILTDPGSAVTRSVVLVSLYWYFGRGFQGGRHRNVVLVYLCVLYTLLELMEDMLDFDAFDQVHKPLMRFLAAFRKTLNLGPAVSTGMSAAKLD